MLDCYRFADAGMLEPVSTKAPDHREAMLSCRIARMVVATVFGAARMPIGGLGQQSFQTMFARQVAMYLSHVGFGIPMVQVAKVFRRDRSTVTHACHAIEDRRDDRQFDAILDQMETAALALRSAHAAWQSR